MDIRLRKVKQFYIKNKRLPTFREMMVIFGFTSVNSVSKLMRKWEEQDILKVVNRKVSPGSAFFSLPLLGSIKAGNPFTEDFYESESVSLDKYLIGNPGFSFLLRVSGDSMIEAGIRSGDLVILDKKREPKNGDIVAAFIDGEWTLKYYFNDKKGLRLVPANPNYSPIYPKQQLETGGVVVKVIREYY